MIANMRDLFDGIYGAFRSIPIAATFSRKHRIVSISAEIFCGRFNMLNVNWPRCRWRCR